MRLPLPGPASLPRMTLETSVSGDVDPDEAWDRYLRPQRWSEWSPQVREVRCRRPRIAPGVTGRVVGPAGTAVDFEVTAVDESRRTWSWRAQAGPVRLELDHGIQPYGVGTRAWLRVAGPMPVVVGYLPVARLALRRLVAP